MIGTCDELLLNPNGVHTGKLSYNFTNLKLDEFTADFRHRNYPKNGECASETKME